MMVAWVLILFVARELVRSYHKKSISLARVIRIMIYFYGSLLRCLMFVDFLSKSAMDYEMYNKFWLHNFA